MMYDLIRSLPPGSRVLDLGSGREGSFPYRRTEALVIALDVCRHPPRPGVHQAALQAQAQAVPLAQESIDVVISNHTMEHFDDPQSALQEVERVLKPGGNAWIAIPDGFSFDDRLYRFLSGGGGHVNQFSQKSFSELVASTASLKITACKPLYSGFVYLYPAPSRVPEGTPKEEQLFFFRLPRPLLGFLVRLFNYGIRRIDRLLSTRLARYGWAFVLRKEGSGDSPIPEPPVAVPADYNVCFSCGAGHPEGLVRRGARWHGLWKVYNCPACGMLNACLLSRRSKSPVRNAG